MKPIGPTNKLSGKQTTTVSYLKYNIQNLRASDSFIWLPPTPSSYTSHPPEKRRFCSVMFMRLWLRIYAGCLIIFFVLIYFVYIEEGPGYRRWCGGERYGRQRRFCFFFSNSGKWMSFINQRRAAIFWFYPKEIFVYRAHKSNIRAKGAIVTSLGFQSAWPLPLSSSPSS